MRLDLTQRRFRRNRFWRKAVIVAYGALMNGNSNQSRLHIAPGTSSARRPALKPYEPQKWKLKIPVSGRPHMFDHDSIPARKWASNLPVSHTVRHSVLAVDNEATDDV